jgi:hypothetical protein
MVKPQMWDEPQYYYCLNHHRVEPVDGCQNQYRLGPFETEQQAANAPALAKARTEAWDEEDRRWEDGDE